MKNHTPGPWVQFDGDLVCVGGDASKMICDIRGWGWLSKKGEEEAIAIQTANAKLIASAPDLIEALQQIASMCDNQNPTHETIWRVAHNAILKATE